MGDSHQAPLNATKNVEYNAVNTLLWAVGSGHAFGVHARRSGFTLVPNQCAVIMR